MDILWKAFLEQRGANIVNQRVVHFDNIVNELQAVAERDTIADLSHKGLIKVSGPDAERFLQGQLTCDITEINTTTSHLAAHCNAKGRVLAAFRVFKYLEDYYLFMPMSIIASTLAQLNKYAIFSKVKLEEVSTQLPAIGITGPNCGKLLSEHLNTIPQHLNHVSNFNEFIIINIFGGVPRFEVFGKVSALMTLWEKLSPPLIQVSSDAWQLLTLRAGIPTVYPATIGRFTPHLINYPAIGGVSFTKGCYTGQEVIARMEYLGKLKSHMYHGHIQCAMIPKPGDLLYAKNRADSDDIGTIVIAKPAPQGGYEFLAVVQDNCVEANTAYLKDCPDATITFLDLPYESKQA